MAVVNLDDLLARADKAVANQTPSSEAWTAIANPPSSPRPPISGPQINAVPGTTLLPAIDIEDPNSPGSGTVTPAPSTADRIGETAVQGPANGVPGAPNAVPGETGGSSNALPSPTPQDDLGAVLQQLDDRVSAVLKQKGIEYTPALSMPQHWNVDDQYAMNKAVSDIAGGFNISLARSLSLPRETVERGMGLLGLDYMQHGGPQQQTIDALNRMGIPTYEVENLANKIGEGALPALATYVAMQLAAPAMAANQGIGAIGYLGREIGQWALKHPIAGLWMGQSAGAGGAIATHAIEPQTTLGKAATELGGELAGGLIPGMVKGAVKLPFKLAGTIIPGAGPAMRVGGKAIGEGINALADNLPTDLANAIKKYNPLYQKPVFTAQKEPLVSENLDANRLQTFSKDQIYAAQTYQDQAIENAINSIPRSGTSAQIQNRTHNLIQDAEKISKNIVSQFWRRVPLKTRIPVNDLRQDVLRMRNELVDNDNTRPDVMIDKILQAVSPTRLPNGQMKAASPTITKLRDLSSQIGTAITEERARDAPREGQVRNLARLSEMIDDNIARQLPNNTSIEQARQMSKRHNDLFSRGPINDILSKRRSGDFRVPQADSIDTLLQKTNGLAALKAVQEGVSTYPRVPTNRFRPASHYNNPYAISQADKATLDEMIKSASDSVRTAFREAADQGEGKAVAYSVKNEEQIKALGNVAGELAWAAQKVSVAVAERKAITSSALARFAQASPEAAVANIFAQKDPADVARQLMISFRGDADALEGLRNQILEELLFNKGKLNPNVIQKLVQMPRIQNLLEATLSVDQNARLNRMINTAVHIGAEDLTSLKEKLISPARTGGKILGAYLGRKIETGTMQAPALISKRVGSWVEKALSGTDYKKLFGLAVLDPNWENLLYSRIPTTTRDMKAALVKYRTIFAGINTTAQQTLNKLSKDDNNAQ